MADIIKYKLTFCFLLMSLYSFSQNENLVGKRHVQLTIGKSKHGTGDIRGLIFSTYYCRNFKKKLSWIVGLGSTIHDGSVPIYFTGATGNLIDASVRYTTAGIQALGYFGCSPVKTIRHELQMRTGTLVRYQSSSYYDQVDIFYPPATGLSYPVLVFNNSNSQRTFALGANAAILYNYTFNKNLTVGIFAELQTDTNGDTLMQLCLSIGRRF